MPCVSKSRRTHIKSRNGCSTCKKHRVRCDEYRPECTRCRRLNLSCGYTEEFSHQYGQQSLLSTDPEKAVTLVHYSLADLPDVQPRDRCIFAHVARMCYRLEECQSHELAFGTLVLPEILKIAVPYDFVRHGVCSLGARHMALLTRSASMIYVEYHHRGVALKGLRRCLESFSNEHIEAVIAASLLLSWQAPRSDEYAHTMQGICSVLHQVKSESCRSTFSHLLLPPKNAGIAAQLAQMDPDTLLDRAEQVMSEMQQTLGRSESYRGISLGIKELKIYVTNLRMQDSNPPSTHRQLTTLFPIRNWMFWIPNAFEQLAQKDPFTMLFFACYEMIHLAVAPLLPAGNLPLALSIRPKFIERINCEFLVLAQSVMEVSQYPSEDVASTLQLFRHLMAGPLRYAKLYNGPSIDQDLCQRINPS